MKSKIAEHIEMRPSAIYGEMAYIVGTRIRVQDVYVWHEKWRLSPQEIVVQFPHLTQADIHAARAFYWDHAEEIQRQMAHERDLYEEGRKLNPA